MASLPSNDVLSISALKALTPLAGFVPGSIGSLYNLYKAISPDLPLDLVPTSVQSSVPGAKVKHFNYDEGHAGRFSVPDTDGGSVDPEWVMSQPNPDRFILKYLTFYDSRGITADYVTTASRWWLLDSFRNNGSAKETVEPSEEPDKASEEPEEPPEEPEEPTEEPEEPTEEPAEPTEEPIEEPAEPIEEPTEQTEEPADPAVEEETQAEPDAQTETSATEITSAVGGPELTIFIPGLNTVHQPSEGETTTVNRLIHYVRIICNLPMAQIHMGTSFDQGTIRVNAINTPLLDMLFNSPLVPDSLKASQEGSELVWHARQIDRLQAALSKLNIVDTPVKKSTRMFLESSSVPNAAPVVLVAYSRGSIEVEAALRKHVEESLEAGEDQAAIETRLRERITVMTVGSATADFPHGPAYIHLAAWTDPLASSSGVTASNNVGGAGRDAVFLNCPSPYHQDAFDNHNFGAVTGQYLSIVMSMSGATGLRDLWEKANRGEMTEPDDADSLIRALIQLTRGYEWLWTPSAAWKDIPPGALPGPEAAEQLLRERLGDEFVERILENFPRQE